jgi:integrase
VADLSKTLAPATVRKVHRVLSLVLAHAVKDGRLVRNVADAVSLPRVVAVEHRYLSHTQAHALADACGPDYRLMVLFLSYTGLRFGEMSALRVGKVDFLRRRAVIAESVTPVKGVLTWGTTKGHERREVPIPRFLVEEMAAHVAAKASDDPVFIGARGAVMRTHVLQKSALTEAAIKTVCRGCIPTSCATPQPVSPSSQEPT